MVKKIAMKTEPKLAMHKYLVTVEDEAAKVGVAHLCFNRDTIREICKRAPVGTSIKVFTVAHNFVQAYKKVADRKAKKTVKK